MVQLTRASREQAAEFARAVGVAFGETGEREEEEYYAKVLPGVHDRTPRLRPGEITRQTQWWDHHFKDPEKERRGGGGRFYAVHESAAGEPDGYISYRYHYNWSGGIALNRVDINDCF